MVLAFHELSPASSFGLAAVGSGTANLAFRYFAKISPHAGQTSAPPDAALHLGQLAYVTGQDLQSITAVVYTSCTSSRFSSASSSFCMRPPSSPARTFSAVGFMVMSASSGLSPAF